MARREQLLSLREKTQDTVIDTGSGVQDALPTKAIDANGNIGTGLDDASKPWVKLDRSGPTFSEVTGPPASPWGHNELYKQKSDFRGAEYVYFF